MENRSLGTVDSQWPQNWKSKAVADVEADSSLPWVHMPKGKFSHVPAHIQYMF